jgi:hypothetical protein
MSQVTKPSTCSLHFCKRPIVGIDRYDLQRALLSREQRGDRLLLAVT